MPKEMHRLCFRHLCQSIWGRQRCRNESRCESIAPRCLTHIVEREIRSNWGAGVPPQVRTDFGSRFLLRIQSGRKRRNFGFHFLLRIQSGGKRTNFGFHFTRNNLSFCNSYNFRTNTNWFRTWNICTGRNRMKQDKFQTYYR